MVAKLSVLAILVAFVGTAFFAPVWTCGACGGTGCTVKKGLTCRMCDGAGRIGFVPTINRVHDLTKNR
jgi:DnaJ-class molecular chaperone